MREALTTRQQQVCDLIVQGMTNRQIGLRLAMSVRTVEEHRKAVFAKLGVRNAVQLVRKVLEASK